MIFSKYKFFLFSPDPDTLVKFYTDVLGLKILKHLNFPKDYGFMLEVAPGYELWIAKHDQVVGKNREPFRHMLNIYTDDVGAFFDQVKKATGVTVIQAPMSIGEIIPGETRKVATILDPEGNCIQVMGS